LKNNFKYKTYYVLLVVGIIFFLYIILVDYTLGVKLEGFPDSQDYRIQSEKSLFSFDFFVPKSHGWYDSRPFSVPLFYKCVNSNPHKMILLQKIIYCFSVFIFIFSFFKHLSNSFIKIVSFYLLLYFFTWWNIVGWSNVILSESLSMSLMFLWLAVILIYYNKQSMSNLILLIFISIIFSFTRDTWPYIIVAFATINIILFLFFKNTALKKNIIFFVFSITLFLIQNYTSNIGERYKIPLFNSIAGRVSQNDSYIDWFKKEGMPMSENLVKDFRGINIDDGDKRLIAYSKYNDTSYVKLFNWILKDGKKKYQKFMISHLSYFFLKDQNKLQTDKIFSTTLSEYIPKPKNFYIKASGTFPYFSISAVFMFLGFLFLLFFYNKSKILLFPIIISLLFTINAFISFNADALEVIRHLFVTQIVLDFIGIISICILSDYLLSLYNSKYKNTLQNAHFH
jgi:hypothetical protein